MPQHHPRRVAAARLGLLQILREDGSILDTPGYDAATGVLYEPRQSFPEVPTAPTWEQVEAARDQLLDIAVDFPFAQECHRAAWLAGLLTPFARFAYEGYTPFFLVDATTAGSGKGTLVDVVSVLVSGGEATRMSHSPSREEEEKRVASMLLTGDLLICVDNISKPFGSDIFDMLITGKTFSPRLLGTNTMLRLTNSSIWWGNGNNVKIKEGADTTRRTLHMRLEPKEEAPDLRDDFKHPNLIEHVLTHRPQLVTAALTILRAYMLARPTAGIKLRSWKSFDEWGQVVRGAVVYVGLPDPYEAHELFRSSSDPVAFALEETVAPDWLVTVDANSRHRPRPAPTGRCATAGGTPPRHPPAPPRTGWAPGTRSPDGSAGTGWPRRATTATAPRRPPPHPRRAPASAGTAG